MKKNYNYNYINRQTVHKADIEYSSVEVATCTSKVLTKTPITDGKLWHTTDSDEFYYDWNGKRTKLNLTGDSASLSAEINKIKSDVAKLDPAKVSKAVSDAQAATESANNAASLAEQASATAEAAAAQVNDKVSQSELNEVKDMINNISLTPGPQGLPGEDGKDGKDGVDGINGADGKDGKDGVDGKSAYDLAVENGFSGTLSEWLDSLKGADGINGQDGQNGTNGADGKDGKDGVDGKSAYDLAVENGFEGTVEEWLTSLKGADGKNGTNGINGQDGQNGVDGKDGKDGVDGKSAYDLAVENGFEGTVEEWLNSLKGADGINGQDGQNGADGKDGVDGINGVDGLDGKDGKSAYELYLDSVSTDKEFLIVDHTNFAQARHNELEDYYNNYPTEASQDGESWPPFTPSAFPWIVVNHAFDGNTVLKLFYKGNEVLSYTPTAEVEREDGTSVARTYAIIGVPSIDPEVFNEFAETVEGTDNLLNANDFDVKLVSAADNLTVDEWLASLKGDKGDKGDGAEIIEGVFPGGNNIENVNAVENGLATVQDVINYVRAYFEKKKDELEDSDSDVYVTPHAYINAYTLNGEPIDITMFNEFDLNESGDTVLEVYAPQEYGMWVDSGDIPSFRLTVDIPVGYSTPILYMWNPFTNDYELLDSESQFVTNPRYSSRTINGVTYNSYVRGPEDEQNPRGTTQYKIIITKE